jgi:hypothetical protein
MRKAFLWNEVEDKARQKSIAFMEGQKSRLLEKEGNELTIMPAGGISLVPEAIDNTLMRIKKSSVDLLEAYNDIVIITDRDDIDSETELLDMISQKAQEYGVQTDGGGAIASGEWLSCSIKTDLGIDHSFRILAFLLPIDGIGAMETFLLNAIAKESTYDATLIHEGNSFVDSVDPERRYLSKRRYITKAKFDVFFSIRTPLEQFNERQRLLLSCPWEEYTAINQGLILLADI